MFDATGPDGTSAINTLPEQLQQLGTIAARYNYNIGIGGTFTSITMGADGLGLISYLDETNGDLKVLHCENTFCAPYFRRR